MQAGIDFGSSLTKAVWQSGDGNLLFGSTVDQSLEQLFGRLSEAGVEELCVLGIGGSQVPGALLEPFRMRRPVGDAIASEISLQVRGARVLLEQQGSSLQEFLLASLGTGISYTLVSGGAARRFPLGSALGGGFLWGLAQLLGVGNFDEIGALAQSSESLDLLIKDLLPESAGSFEGDLAIAHFAKASASTPPEHALASVLNCIASSLMKDLLLLDMAKGYECPQDVVFIGSPLSRCPVLGRFLEQHIKALSRRAHFVEGGEYSLAMGAYLWGNEV